MRVAVIGGSLGGLASAVAFSRLGAETKVFERSVEGFAGRGSSLGFCDVAMWERLTGKRMMRRGEQATRRQGAFMYGDLWQYLASSLKSTDTIAYGAHVLDLGDPQQPTVNGERFDLVVIADGGWSELRSRYFTEEKPTYAGFQVWRFKV